MAHFQDSTRFWPASGVEINRVPDGAMAYQADRERVHFLNLTAFLIYELCGMGKSAGEMERFVADAFGLDPAPADAVKACLSSLLDEGLVVRAPDPLP